MIIIKKGNLLEAEEDILVHQVNVDAVMGGGVAKQIAEKYSNAERDYIKICVENNNNYENLKGKVDLTFENGKYIASIFSQDKNFNTDYESMRQALELVKGFAEQEKLSVAMPRNMGNGIANGIEGKAEQVAREIFENTNVCITLYELEEK